MRKYVYAAEARGWSEVFAKLLPYQDEFREVLATTPAATSLMRVSVTIIMSQSIRGIDTWHDMGYNEVSKSPARGHKRGRPWPSPFFLPVRLKIRGLR